MGHSGAPNVVLISKSEMYIEYILKIATLTFYTALFHIN